MNTHTHTVISCGPFHGCCPTRAQQGPPSTSHKEKVAMFDISIKLLCKEECVVVTMEVVFFVVTKTQTFSFDLNVFLCPFPASYFVSGSLCDEHCSDSEIEVKISLAPSAYLNRECWMKNTKECIVLMGAFH